MKLQKRETKKVLLQSFFSTYLIINNSSVFTYTKAVVLNLFFAWRHTFLRMKNMRHILALKLNKNAKLHVKIAKT
jgi:hypothetical protein